VLFEDPDGIRLEVNHVPGKGLLAEPATAGGGSADQTRVAEREPRLKDRPRLKNLILASMALFGMVLCDCGTAAYPDGDGPAASTVSCATAAGFGHECITYSGVVGPDDCIGKMTVSSCPSGIGTCTLTEGADGVTTATTYYADFGSSAANEQSGCTGIGGVWSD
jgi:hypothetical protein